MADTPKPRLVLAKPPKPVDEMTEVELDDFSMRIFDALAETVAPEPF